MRLTNRYQLLNYLDEHAPTRSIKRALQEGGVEFLGGFRYIPPIHRPGWITKVTSRFGKTWNVVVTIPIDFRAFNIAIIKEIPWEYWDGDDSINPLYQGDYPEKYKNEKMAAIKRRS